MEFSQDYGKEQAPFNMALATLEDIRKILNEIKEVSIGWIQGTKIPDNESQHTKYRLVKQLKNRSNPLIEKPETRKKIKDAFDKIKLKWIRVRTSANRNARRIEAYNEEVEEQLEDLINLIQEKLQERGHFMPKKSESNLF